MRKPPARQLPRREAKQAPRPPPAQAHPKLPVGPPPAPEPRPSIRQAAGGAFPHCPQSRVPEAAPRTLRFELPAHPPRGTTRKQEPAAWSAGTGKRWRQEPRCPVSHCACLLAFPLLPPRTSLRTSRRRLRRPEPPRARPSPFGSSRSRERRFPPGVHPRSRRQRQQRPEARLPSL
jgi:hypothetical protein